MRNLWANEAWKYMLNQKARVELDLSHLGVSRNIDEMAIYCDTQDQVDWLLNLDGVEHFNTVEDTLHVALHPELVTTPEQMDFDVKFWFVRPTLTPSWRVEIMRKLRGMSSIHDPLRGSDCVHASFKCEDLGDYTVACSELRRAGYRRFGEFTNSYGQFSYWNQEYAPIPYVKPRVNLRDA